MEKKLDLSKPVRTRSDLPARILCCDRKGTNIKPIIALITLANGAEEIYSYTKEGYLNPNEVHVFDLVNSTQKYKGHLVLYRTPNQDNLHDKFTQCSNKVLFTEKELNDFIDRIKSYAANITILDVEWEE